MLKKVSELHDLSKAQKSRIAELEAQSVRVKRVQVKRLLMRKPPKRPPLRSGSVSDDSEDSPSDDLSSSDSDTDEAEEQKVLEKHSAKMRKSLLDRFKNVWRKDDATRISFRCCLDISFSTSECADL